ncbi:MAG: uracil phosphoribosyltransferase [Oscillatoriales cyanobacterium RM1_1_9]|nr:uracil phosphoribosyltransferase [Oscillatoriales cyanobacterium SM2_3_0]NJO45842.1 uracil phosphoribosyltransferase [Oscillatoriales cyanobacterium RM2_1_1]NJO70628.1 uracil phosphoribosyltransferase [Oscillatoriales cyanobacterium RM1_1_9]
MTLQLRVYVPPHPLIKHWLAVARDVETPSVLFRTAMTELGRWLTYEAARNWLPTLDATVTTPLTECPATYINPEVPMVIVPILRAGLALMEGIQSVVPLTAVYHLGMARNEETLESHCYLNKLPPEFPPGTHVIVSEPMLATGGTIITAMAELTARGIDPALTRIISVVVAPPALRRLSDTYPSLQIYTAIIDEGLNGKGFIVPGLGDAGDRTFGT